MNMKNKKRWHRIQVTEDPIHKKDPGWELWQTMLAASTAWDAGRGTRKSSLGEKENALE